MRQHRDPDDCRDLIGRADCVRQAAGFRAEQQVIPRLVVHAVIGGRALGADGKNPRRAAFSQEIAPIPVGPNFAVFAVIQASPTQAFVIQGEAQGLDEMQRATCVAAQAVGISGVRRDFRLKKNDVEH